MQPDVDRFLARFVAFGARPSPQSYLPLFHPAATLFDSGMERPITVPEIPEHIAGILALVPDFRMVPERWRARGSTVFVEARNHATLANERVQWRSVYCVDLEGEYVVRGRRYYDRQPLLARVLPKLPALPPFVPTTDEACLPEVDPIHDPAELVKACVDCWQTGAPQALQRLYREDGCLLSAGLERPLARAEIPSWLRALAAAIPDLRLGLETWAGDAELVFLEWSAHGTLGGQPLQLGIADRLDLAAGLVLHGRAYFDTTALAARLAPPAG